MSQRAALRALQMARTKLLEAAEALDRAAPARDGPHLHFTISLSGRDHIRGALLQALALTEQVEEELEEETKAYEDTEAAIARGEAILHDCMQAREGIRPHLERLRRRAAEEAASEN